MMEDGRPRPLREAARITLMLDHVLGPDRLDAAPVDVERLALEYSASIAPRTPIHEVIDRDIPGCMGALLYGDDVPRQWGIVCHLGQSVGKRRFTIAHELGHYVLHRHMIEEDESFDGGIWCDEASVHRGGGNDIEREADSFAASLLMPLHDCRKLLPARRRPDLDELGRMANRYGVSLTLMVLRWLEYTETRAVMVVSNEGFGLWSKSSDAAFRSGAFVRTRNTVYELPRESFAVTRDYGAEAKSGLARPAGMWFPEPVVEMGVRSERLDYEVTLIHLEPGWPRHQEEAEETDVYDRFSRSG